MQHWCWRRLPGPHFSNYKMLMTVWLWLLMVHCKFWFHLWWWLAIQLFFKWVVVSDLVFVELSWVMMDLKWMINLCLLALHTVERSGTGNHWNTTTHILQQTVNFWFILYHHNKKQHFYKYNDEWSGGNVNVKCTCFTVTNVHVFVMSQSQKSPSSFAPVVADNYLVKHENKQISFYNTTRYIEWLQLYYLAVPPDPEYATLLLWL
jgi:hypothetical protein